MVELKKLAKLGRSKPADDEVPDPVRDAAKEAFDREVEEELRREQIEKIWAHYSKHILAAAALIVLGVGGWKFIESRQIAAMNASGARFEAAAGLAEAKKTAEAQQAFSAIAKDSPAGYRMLASLRIAASELTNGRTAEALAAYEAAASTPGADPLLADFARLQIASLKIDTADWTEMQNRLTPLATDKSPWRYSARELLGLAALKAGKSDQAKTTFEQLIADRRVPPSISERARIAMDSIVAAELAKAGPTAQPKASAPAPKKE